MLWKDWALCAAGASRGRLGFSIEQQARKSIDRPGHIEQRRSGVNIHRQVNRGVTHGGLGHARRDAGLGQVRAAARSRSKFPNILSGISKSGVAVLYAP